MAEQMHRPADLVDHAPYVRSQCLDHAVPFRIGGRRLVLATLVDRDDIEPRLRQPFHDQQIVLLAPGVPGQQDDRWISW